MLFADGIVLVAASLEEVDNWVKECKEALDGKGLRISRSKAAYVESGVDLRVWRK